MVVRQANQRLAILFDADNVELLKRDGELRRVKIDLTRILNRINHRELTRAIYYRPFRHFPETERQWVEQHGFEARATYKNSDPWIIADALALANRVDVVAFVGVDRDFEPIIPMIKSCGVRVEGYGWRNKSSKFMQRLLDAFVPLSGDLIIEDESEDAANFKEAPSNKFAEGVYSNQA